MSSDASLTDHERAVLLRGSIEQLQYPRLCASRLCHRHHRCRDIAARDPRCIRKLHHKDQYPLANLYWRLVDILTGRKPPQELTDPVESQREDEANVVLWRCIDDLPAYRDGFIAWYQRYRQPPMPPAPPLPPGFKDNLLADIRRELAHIRTIDIAPDR